MMMRSQHALLLPPLTKVQLGMPSCACFVGTLR